MTRLMLVFCIVFRLPLECGSILPTIYDSQLTSINRSHVEIPMLMFQTSDKFIHIASVPLADKYLVIRSC